MQGTLHKIKSSHNNVRTDTMDGEIENPPIVGQDFVIWGESLSFKGGGREIRTTPVKTVTYSDIDKTYYFTTENSEYKFEVKELGKTFPEKPKPILLEIDI